MTPDIFIEKAQRLERRMLAQGLLRSTMLSMHEAASAAGDGVSENVFRVKLHGLLDESLDLSNELTKLKEIFVKSNR